MLALERPQLNGQAPKVASFTLLPPKWRRRYLYAAIAAVLVLAIAAALFVRARTADAIAYTTVPVERRDLVQSVTATGTVNPQNTISVGTQVSGTLSEVNVDFNSHVKKGQVLARIDPTTFRAALDQARAVLAQAQAQAASAAATAAGGQSGIGSAQANLQASAAQARASAATAQANDAAIATAVSNVSKSQAALSLAQATVNRDNQLLSQGYIAQSQADADRSSLVAAQSALDSAQAALTQSRATAAAGAAQAQASQAQIAAQTYSVGSAQDAAANQADLALAGQANVASAEAQVKAAELNLERTVITSPVDGTVVARDVSVGTTVAASLQTPTLFSIAQDLRKMEADVAVGEPDIGNVKVGDSVDFSVLAYPNQVFHGTVSQVRINPVTSSNVVTYTTVIAVDNQNGQLLPGMTANATISVTTAKNALVVPVAALQYQPAGFAGGQRRRIRSGNGSTQNVASPWGATSGGTSSSLTAGSRGRIFVQRNGSLVRVPVNVVLSNGTDAAVTPLGDATLGTSDTVVTGDSSSTHGSGTRGSTNVPRNPLAGVSGGYGGGGPRG